MQVKKRLQINVAFSIMAAGVIIAMLTTAVHHILNAVETSNIADELVSSVYQQSEFRNEYMWSTNERARVQWFAKHEKIVLLLQSALEKFKDAEDKTIVERMAKDQEPIARIFSSIVENREKPQLNPVLSQEVEDTLVSQMNMKRDNTILDARRLQESASKRLLFSLRTSGWGILCVIITLTAAATVNSWSMGRVITKRITALRNGTAIIGEGNLDQRIDITGDDEFAELSEAFNAPRKTGGFSAMGFSPFWNQDFLDSAFLLFGVRIRPGRNGLPAWDQDGLGKTVDFARSWLSEVNGGASADEAFTSQNWVQPWYKLISGKKILFALASFTDYFALPEEKRRDLDFRWLALGNSIPVMNDALFAGVLRSSRNKGGARAFLEWFCNPSVQRSLLDVNQSRRIGVFGVTDGFSALKSINERELPQKYPFLLGHIPSETILAFPETLPDNWLAVRDQVIRPWVHQSASGAGDQSLEKMLEDWAKGMKK